MTIRVRAIVGVVVFGLASLTAWAFAFGALFLDALGNELCTSCSANAAAYSSSIWLFVLATVFTAAVGGCVIVMRRHPPVAAVRRKSNRLGLR